MFPIRTADNFIEPRSTSTVFIPYSSKKLFMAIYQEKECISGNASKIYGTWHTDYSDGSDFRFYLTGRPRFLFIKQCHRRS